MVVVVVGVVVAVAVGVVVVVAVGVGVGVAVAVAVVVGIALGGQFTGSGEDAREKNHIDAIVDWAKTARGGKYDDFFKIIDGPACSSIYGLCE